MSYLTLEQQTEFIKQQLARSAVTVLDARLALVRAEAAHAALERELIQLLPAKEE